MASLSSPSSLPAQPKRAFPASFSSARRTSTSAIPIASFTNTSPSPPKNSPNTSTPTGIPAFRSLRSLLPFGPNKQTTPVSSAISPTSHVSRSPFAHFGSVRRSMNRERKASLDVELPPVISIDRSSRDEAEVRRSVSCSRLEKPLPPLNEGTSNPFDDNDDTVVFSAHGAPILRTPSPGPPISADLSTILEADTSGLSKHVPSSSDPSRSPSPDAPTSSDLPLAVTSQDTSILDLSTSQLTNQVLDAMMLEDSNTATQWLNADKAVIIDRDYAEPEPDASFNLGALDADLAALLSPYRLPAQSTSANIKNLTINPQPPSQRRQPIDLSKLSPASPQFTLSPSSPNPIFTTPLPGGSASPSSLGSLRSRLPRQQSSLPRLRPPLPPSPHSPHSPTPSSTVPSSIVSDSTGQDDDGTARIDLPRPSLQRYAPPSPLAASASASGVTGSSKIAPKPNPPPSPSASASTSTSFLSRRFTSHSHSAKSLTTMTPATSTTSPSTSTSTLSRLKAPFTQANSVEKRPGLLRTASSPANDSDHRPSFSPSPSPSRLGARPSLDSTARGSESFDRIRTSLSPAPPGLHVEYETPARPSLDTLRGTGASSSGSGGSAGLARARKRSMSVQERLGRHLLSGPRRNGFGGEGERERDEEDNGGEFGERRPSSSLSGRMGKRWEGSGVDVGGGSVSGSGRAPITEWLGPRTVKAFKAAGLIDFDRDQQHERSSISALGSGAGPGTLGRFASMRSTSEYNPRAPSRMAFSEAGGSSASRRGSVSGTGVGMSYGLMESPTFTTSSGSRDRDTPRSASTAPTSVSGSSFAFLGRDRDRDRDRDREREETSELKDKHAIETGALLSALSDSQRTTRVLREENGELRERLEQVGAENDALRRVVGELTKEAGELRVQMQMLKVSSSTSRLGVGTWSIPSRRSGLSTPIYVGGDEEGDAEWGTPVKGDGERDHDSSDVPQDKRQTFLNRNGRETNEGHQRLHGDDLELSNVGPAFSSTPAAPKHRRRFSTTSSIFPVPPANMTMLLHDHDPNDSVSLNGSLDHSQFSPRAPMPIRGGKVPVNSHAHDNSVASTTNISPTTANFSMTTGSPGSLFLRPEHEMHLGDMDSLDLGIRRDVNIAMDDGGWSE